MWLTVTSSPLLATRQALFSPALLQAFRPAVRALLRGKTPVVGALTAPIYGHRVPFVDEIQKRKQVQLATTEDTNCFDET